MSEWMQRTDETEMEMTVVSQFGITKSLAYKSQTDTTFSLW